MSTIKQCESNSDPCPLGHYSLAGATTCSPCPVGRYGDRTGLGQCTGCKAGQGTNETGSTSPSVCRDCASGSYSTGDGECILCELGTYGSNNITGATTKTDGCPHKCKAPNVGRTVGSVDEEDACGPCPDGEYSIIDGGSLDDCIAYPSSAPSSRPSSRPTSTPTGIPSSAPSLAPTANPTRTYLEYRGEDEGLKVEAGSKYQSDPQTGPHYKYQTTFTNLGHGEDKEWWLALSVYKTGFGPDTSQYISFSLNNETSPLVYPAGNEKAGSRIICAPAQPEIGFAGCATSATVSNGDDGWHSCIMNLKVGDKTLPSLGGSLTVHSTTNGVLSSSCPKNHNGVDHAVFVKYELFSAPQVTPSPSAAPTLANPETVQSINGIQFNAQDATLWQMLYTTSLVAIICAAGGVYLSGIRKKAKHERVQKLAAWKSALKLGLLGAELVSLFFVIVALCNSEFKTYGAVLSIFRLMHVLVAAYLMCYIHGPEEWRKASSFGSLLDRHHLAEKGKEYSFVTIASFIDISFIVFLPWLQSEFADNTKGFPSFNFYLTVQLTIIASGIISFVCQAPYLEATGLQNEGDLIMAMNLAFSSLKLFMIMMDAWLKGSTFRQSAVAEPYDENDAGNDDDSDDDKEKQRLKRAARNKKRNQKRNRNRAKATDTAATSSPQSSGGNSNNENEDASIDDMGFASLYEDEGMTSTHNPMITPSTSGNDLHENLSMPSFGDRQKEGDDDDDDDDYNYENYYDEDDEEDYVARSELESLLKERDEDHLKRMKERDKENERRVKQIVEEKDEDHLKRMKERDEDHLERMKERDEENERRVREIVEERIGLLSSAPLVQRRESTVNSKSLKPSMSNIGKNAYSDNRKSVIASSRSNTAVSTSANAMSTSKSTNNDETVSTSSRRDSIPVRHSEVSDVVEDTVVVRRNKQSSVVDGGGSSLVSMGNDNDDVEEEGDI